ncbi:hypothetical protein SUGI_0084760 [Cryptomeria japonica]|nr:hypothetical protein SUGI_0084760 [Cryptomeria japonica]
MLRIECHLGAKAPVGVDRSGMNVLSVNVVSDASVQLLPRREKLERGIKRILEGGETINFDPDRAKEGRSPNKPTARAGTELSQNDIVGGGLLTPDDAPKEKDLDPLDTNPIKLQKGGLPNHRTIKYSRSDESVQKSHLGRGVLEVMAEAFSLKKGQRTIPFVDARLDGRSHAETRA